MQYDEVLSGGQRSATLQVLGDVINSIPFRSNNSSNFDQAINLSCEIMAPMY